MIAASASLTARFPTASPCNSFADRLAESAPAILPPYQFMAHQLVKISVEAIRNGVDAQSPNSRRFRTQMASSQRNEIRRAF